MAARRRFRVVLIALILLLLIPVGVKAVEWWNGQLEIGDAVAVEVIASGFKEPTALLVDEDGILIAERDGLIRASDGALVVDLTGVVVADDLEQGLLGMARRDGRLFVHLTDPASVVAEVTDGGLVELLRTEPVSPNHNGGGLAFGPDGELYASLGDGSPGGDSLGYAQRTDDLFGSIVRVTPEPTIVNLGLRNPWRFSFDGGDLWIADVGQNWVEEINVQRAGETMPNFGWSVFEGTECYENSAYDCEADGLTVPAVELNRRDDQISGDCALIGGYVYRGSEIPSLVGRYVFGDWCSGRIFSVDAETPGRVRLELDTDLAITAFAQGQDGELYLVAFGGEVARLAPPG